MARLFGARAGGKAPTADFTVDMLPHNRRELFFDIIKLRWTKFFAQGALTVLFMLPMILFSWIEDSYNYGIIQEMSSLPEAERMELYGKMLSMSNTKAMLNIFSFLLVSVCIAGIVRIVRQCSWRENISLGYDFIKGVKQNIGQMALLALAVGTVNFLSVYTYNLLCLSANQPAAVLLSVSFGTVLFIGIPLAAYTVVVVSVYNNTFFENLKTALFVFAKVPLRSILALVCCFLPYVPSQIPNIYCRVFGSIAGGLVTPVVLLAWFLFASNQLDKYVNREHYPQLVGRGILSKKFDN